ncbi:MAG TPA: phosphoribosyltransferase family protein, partial [Anaerolineae bacterium]|nr:phosphoribosyltransferase family protein [Anaerolineae bacterium]
MKPEAIIDRVLVDESSLRQRVSELARTISADYQGRDLVLVCVLKGGVTFLTDLMRQITVPHEVEFMAISSYGSGRRESSGAVRLIMDLKHDIAGRDVLLIEDIVDSGQTM